MAASPSVWANPLGGGPQSFQQFARKGYMGNEIVFSAIELLATSAAEPHIIGRRWRRESPRFAGLTNDADVRQAVRAETAGLLAKGLPLARVYDLLVQNGFIIQVPNHALAKLLNAPNPFMSRGQLWSTVVMDRYLAGNAYLLKARNEGLGNVQELWRLRPDRVRIIPDKATFCRYEYRIGREIVTFEHRDVMHFKTRNPLDDYYGMPPLMAVTGRLDIEAYMRGFLQMFFSRGGTGPGAILTVKQRLSDGAKDEIRAQHRTQYGTGNWLDLMILDNAESSYEQMGLNRGLRDALPKEIDSMQEARIAMVFGIPGSILGLLIGYESSSYANKRQDWQVFWDITMAPLMSDLDDVLNLSLKPEFSGIDEVLFDMSGIKALQEDVDKIQERARKNVAGGIWSWEEGRDATGVEPSPSEGTFFLPSNAIPVKAATLDGGQVQGPEPMQVLRMLFAPQLSVPATIDEVHCPRCGRWIGRNMNAGATAFCPKCNEEVEVRI